jgi:hypothetical protein
MKTVGHRFPRHGTLGLLLLLLMETAIFCASTNVLPQIEWWRVTMWTTPVCWWGYIFVMDAWIYKRRGTSPLSDRRDGFVAMCLISIATWCLFEAYNRVMPGWQYIHLTENLSLRLLGYAVSFATIMPGVFLTCEWLQTHDAFVTWRLPRIRWTSGRLTASVVVGAIFSVVPPFCPPEVRGYLWAFVWTGWFFLLEPINYRRGAQSLYRDWERGSWGRTMQLMAAGAICGLLWEFWNAWAHTKWVYTFPLGQNLKYFEMPLVGFLGFLPFALELFAMFHFVSSLFTKEDKLGL